MKQRFLDIMDTPITWGAWGKLYLIVMAISAVVYGLCYISIKIKEKLLTI